MKRILRNTILTGIFVFLIVVMMTVFAAADDNESQMVPFLPDDNPTAPSKFDPPAYDDLNDPGGSAFVKLQSVTYNVPNHGIADSPDLTMQLAVIGKGNGVYEISVHVQWYNQQPNVGYLDAIGICIKNLTIQSQNVTPVFNTPIGSEPVATSLPSIYSFGWQGIVFPIDLRNSHAANFICDISFLASVSNPSVDCDFDVTVAYTHQCENEYQSDPGFIANPAFPKDKKFCGYMYDEGQNEYCYAYFGDVLHHTAVS